MMNKTYRLYLIRFANGVMITKYIDSVMAENMIEAEFLLEARMNGGDEYIITAKK